MFRRRRSSSKSRRSFPGELAYRSTQVWVVVALLSIFFLNGIAPDKTGFQIHPNYMFLVLTALVPAAAWSWYFYAQDKQKAAGKSLQELQVLAPDAFEEWVAARFRDLGYSAKVTGTQGSGGDHGVDIIAEKPDEKAVIQCKNWKAWKVGEPKLRDLYGAMTDLGASRAYLVTTGSVTEPARRWIAGKPIEVWDGDTLARLSKLLATKDTSSRGNAVMIEALDSSGPEMISASTVKVAINCPQCGSALVERRNSRTGELFLGCSHYPTCRHTQPLAS